MISENTDFGLGASPTQEELVAQYQALGCTVVPKYALNNPLAMDAIIKAVVASDKPLSLEQIAQIIREFE